MAIAQISQIWLATFCLDPAICRDTLRYLRALGDLLTDAPADDPELSIPRAAWQHVASLVREGCTWFVPASAGDRADAAVVPVLTHTH